MGPFRSKNRYRPWTRPDRWIIPRPEGTTPISTNDVSCPVPTAAKTKSSSGSVSSSSWCRGRWGTPWVRTGQVRCQLAFSDGPLMFPPDRGLRPLLWSSRQACWGLYLRRVRSLLGRLPRTKSVHGKTVWPSGHPGKRSKSRMFPLVPPDTPSLWRPRRRGHRWRWSRPL